jgi:hypothetical protein
MSTFGSNDKVVLVSGILVVLAFFAAGIGMAAVRRLSRGMTGLAFFAVIGLIAVMTRPGSSFADVLPTLAATAAGAVALYYLVRAAGTVTARRGQAAVRTPARPARAATATAPAGAGSGSRTPGAAEPGATALRPGAVPEGAVRQHAGPHAGDDASPAPPGPPPPPGRGSPPPGPARRRFLVTSAAVAGTAAVAGLGGRLLSERSSVAQARAALRVPVPARPGPALPPGTDFRLPGLSPFITPNKTFYRVDTAIVLPQVPPSSWSLRIHGMVRREMEISFKELIGRR